MSRMPACPGAPAEACSPPLHPIPNAPGNPCALRACRSWQLPLARMEELHNPRHSPAAAPARSDPRHMVGSIQYSQRVSGPDHCVVGLPHTTAGVEASARHKASGRHADAITGDACVAADHSAERTERSRGAVRRRIPSVALGPGHAAKDDSECVSHMRADQLARIASQFASVTAHSQAASKPGGSECDADRRVAQWGAF